MTMGIGGKKDLNLAKTNAAFGEEVKMAGRPPAPCVLRLLLDTYFSAFPTQQQQQQQQNNQHHGHKELLQVVEDAEIDNRHNEWMNLHHTRTTFDDDNDHTRSGEEGAV